MKGAVCIALLVLALPSELAFAQCVDATPTRVYGYTLEVTYSQMCATKFKTLEEAELALRTDTGNSAGPAESLAFTVPNDMFSNPITNVGYMDYRPNGAIPGNSSVLTGGPASLSQAYSAYVTGWATLVPAPGCPATCSGGICPTLADETALAQCEFDATWSSHPNFAWTRSGAAQSGDNISGAPQQITGAGQPSGALIYRPTSSVASGWGSTISITANQASASPSPPGVQEGSPDATQSQTWIWNLQRQDNLTCPAGATVSGSATSSADACHSAYIKVIVAPPTFTQSPGTCPVGDPCFPANGNNLVTERGFRYGEIRFDLYYNSLRQSRPYSYIDRNWSDTFAKRVLTEWSTDGHLNTGVDNADPLSRTYMIVQDEQAALETFNATSPQSGVFRSTSTVGNVLIYHAPAKGNPYFLELDREDGSVEIYDRTGRLTQIINPDDPRKTLTLSYLGPPLPTTQYFDVSAIPADEAFWRLGSVQDGTGRSVSFHYSNDQFLWLTDVIADDATTTLVHFDFDMAHRMQRMTFADQTYRQYLYNETGDIYVGGTVPPGITGYWLTGILDESGRRYSTFKYDDWGRVVANWHGVNAEKVTLTYATDNLDSSTTATLPLGDQVTYSYSSTEPYRHALTKSDPSGPWGYHYDPSTHRMDRRTDPNGNVTTFEYDTNAVHMTARTDGLNAPEQRRIETDWDVVTNRISARRIYSQPNNGAKSLESEVTYDYDDATGHILGRSETGPAVDDGVRTWTYSYCTTTDAASGCVAGLLHSIDGPRTDVVDTTTFKYYTSTDLSGCASGPSGACHHVGDLSSVTDALSHTTSYSSYNQFGDPVRTVEANGVITDYTYGPRAWLTDRIVRANANGTASSGDAITHIDYDASGNVLKTTDPDGYNNPNGPFLAYTYDSAHRLVKIADGLGNSIDYCPGGEGTQQCLAPDGHRVVEQIKDAANALRRSLARSFDTLGRLVTAKSSAGIAIQDFTGVSSPEGYDANGNPTHWRDNLHVETVHQYDALDRLHAIIQDYAGTGPTAQATTLYGYDARNNVLSITDADNVATGYLYNAFNEVKAITSHDTGSTSFSYDSAGNRKTQHDANGVDVTYQYDALNRLTNVIYTTANLNQTFAFDQLNNITGCASSYPIGRLTRITDHSGTTTYCYDLRGNVIRKTQTIGGVVLTTGATYTLGDRLSSLTYPSGAVVSYVRNGAGRVTSVQWRASATASPVTLVSGVTYYPFGPANVLTFGNGRTLTKTYDLDYHIDSIESSASTGLSMTMGVNVLGDVTSIDTASEHRKFQYDPLHRLTSSYDASTTYESYTYSKGGDRLTKSLLGQSSLTYTYYPGTHRLRTIGSGGGLPLGRTYDSNGNLLDDRVGDVFSYDNRNRPVTATASPNTYTFDYGARGERVSQVRSTPNFADLTKRFVYGEDGLRLAEISYATHNAQSSSVEYVYIDDTAIAMVSYQAAGSSGALSYVESDQLGTARLGVDPATNASLWGWDPTQSTFGENPPDGTFYGSSRFPGQFADTALLFNYNGYRDYEPATGRYAQPDPIGVFGRSFMYGGDRASTNNYAYAKDSPLRLSDRLGLTDSVCGYGDHFVVDPGTEGVGLQGHCEPDPFPDHSLKPMCAAGAVDCLILDGTNPGRTGGPNLCDYDRLGNNICYAMCITRDDKDSVNLNLSRLGRIFGGRKGGNIGEAIDISIWLAIQYRHHATCLKECNIK